MSESPEVLTHRAFMDFVSIESPAVRITTAGQTFKFFNTSLRIVLAGQVANVLADKLVQAFA